MKNLDAVIREIENAGAMEIEVLMDVVFERKRQLFRDWELCYIAMPKNDWDERERTLENLLELERQVRKLSEGRKELMRNVQDGLVPILHLLFFNWRGSAPAFISALRAAFGGCAPKRACGRSPLGKVAEHSEVGRGHNCAEIYEQSGALCCTSPALCRGHPPQRGGLGAPAPQQSQKSKIYLTYRKM